MSSLESIPKPANAKKKSDFLPIPAQSQPHPVIAQPKIESTSRVDQLLSQVHQKRVKSERLGSSLLSPVSPPKATAPQNSDALVHKLLGFASPALGYSRSAKQYPDDQLVGDFVTGDMAFEHLQEFGSSPADVRQAFKERYDDKQPDGLSVNSSTYYNSPVPAPTEQYGKKCYLVMPRMVEINEDDTLITPSGPPDTFRTYTTYNNTSLPGHYTLAYHDGWSRQHTINRQSSISLGLTFEVGLEVVSSVSGTFTYNYTWGETDTDTESTLMQISHTHTVPPYYVQQARESTWSSYQQVDFTRPVRINGWFGANFPRKVNGHWWWFVVEEYLIEAPSRDIIERYNIKVDVVETVINEQELTPAQREELAEEFIKPDDWEEN